MAKLTGIQEPRIRSLEMDQMIRHSCDDVLDLLSPYPMSPIIKIERRNELFDPFIGKEPFIIRVILDTLSHLDAGCGTLPVKLV